MREFTKDGNGNKLDALRKRAEPLESQIAAYESPAVSSAYDRLAATYALMFRDWEECARRDAALVEKIIAERLTPGLPVRILDPACGIGKPALQLAEDGYIVTGCDISEASIEYARLAAAKRGLQLRLEVADICAVWNLFPSPNSTQRSCLEIRYAPF
jgi:2-polyprenyl-3-methyl-5-hydroxy-6-metoxy-1,4-benzoquinol methylase